MELRHIRYLSAIHAHGSLTAAARVLGVGQPTLSDSMRRLEEDLGAQLLIRHPRGVELTAAGELALAHVEPILAELAALPGLLHDLREDVSGSFRLGCYHSLGAWLLPPVLARLVEEWPDLEVQLVGARSSSVERAVLDRECDLGLVVNARPHPDLVIVPVSTDAVVFVASRARLAEQSGRDLLRQGPLLYLDTEPFSTLIDRVAALGLLPRRHMPLGDLELVKAVASAGTGVAVLPARVAAYGASPLTLLDPTLPRFDDTIHLIVRYDTPRTRALKALRTLLVEEGQRIAETSWLPG